MCGQDEVALFISPVCKWIFFYFDSEIAVLSAFEMRSCSISYADLQGCAFIKPFYCASGFRHRRQYVFRLSVRPKPERLYFHPYFNKTFPSRRSCWNCSQPRPPSSQEHKPLSADYCDLSWCWEYSNRNIAQSIQMKIHCFYMNTGFNERNVQVQIDLKRVSFCYCITIAITRLQKDGRRYKYIYYEMGVCLSSSNSSVLYLEKQALHFMVYGAKKMNIAPNNFMVPSICIVSVKSPDRSFKKPEMRKRNAGLPLTWWGPFTSMVWLRYWD